MNSFKLEKLNITQEDFELKAQKILDDVRDILFKKNKDYGGASFDLGIIGNYVHIHDKENRLKSLIERYYSGGESANFESIQDTYKDLIGYSVIGTIIFDAIKEES